MYFIMSLLSRLALLLSVSRSNRSEISSPALMVSETAWCLISDFDFAGGFASWFGFCASCGFEGTGGLAETPGFDFKEGFFGGGRGLLLGNCGLSGG